MESDARSGRLSTSRNDELIDQVRTLVMQGRRVTVRELVEVVGVSVLTDDLAMWRVSEKRGTCIMTTHQLILGQTQHSCSSTGSLHSRHGFLRFFGIPEMLRTMEERIVEVCSVTRSLLRRALGLQVSRRVNVFFAAKGRILFEQTTYVLINVWKYTGNVCLKKI